MRDHKHFDELGLNRTWILSGFSLQNNLSSS